MSAFRKLVKVRELSSILFLAALLAIVGLKNADFLRLSNLITLLNNSVVYTLLACGIAFVILTGEIDVSIGGTLCMSAVVSSTLLRDGAPWILAFLAGLAVGVVIGLVNGWGVALLGIPSLIFTLGTYGLVRGLIYVYTKGAWIENLPAAFTNLANVKLFGDLTVFYFAVIVLVVISHLLLTKTRRGKYFIAVGDNTAGATLVGIPTKQTKLLSYVLCGVFAAVAGIMYSARIGFITPTAGSGYEMTAIAACVLGGISLTGGLGSLIGASIGAIIMSSISPILVFFNLSSTLDNTITGTLLITIVVVDALLQRRMAVKNRRKRLVARTALEAAVKGESH